ncbi:MAG: DUF1538 domain-containing protein [Treponema sp.]|jgi:hypothetical protein|nr:DUF1538 domain-containing protein [Treponema sp.]
MAQHVESSTTPDMKEKTPLAGGPGKKVRISFKQGISLISSYASSRLGAQLRSVAFVVIYLVLAQTFILKAPVQQVLWVAFGVGATIAGLAFFLEGLILGIMPLGEQCGLRLPPKAGPLGVAIFAIIIGVTATLAEPAIGFLKIQGSAVAPWDAPLLYLILNRGSGWLVMAVAIGVGLSVLIGVFRFLYGWPFKPAVFLIIPVLVVISFVFERNPLLKPVAGLAWDTGGVTTGPVTVPLVIALGVGVSKIAGRSNKGGASGLGVVTLASALPVVAVFLLAFVLSEKVPGPSSAAAFFSDDPLVRGRAEYVAGDQDALIGMAQNALAQGFLQETQFRSLFPDAPLKAQPRDTPVVQTADTGTPLTNIWRYIKDALSAVLPLAGVLVITILIVIRERIRELDEVILGLIFTIVGMSLFGIGMERGISALGSQAGAALPRAYAETVQPDEVVHGVDDSSIFTVPGPRGGVSYIWIPGDSGPEAKPFMPSKLNQDTHTYRHIPIESAVFSKWGRTAGLVVVLIFVFILGLGATFAEPSLAALGLTVEELTTGTYRKSTLVTNVAVGVGLGMAAGFACILFKLSLAWMLGVPYALALILTLGSSEEFASIAWDAAGVTTGPVTVPLVIAAGLGIGKEAGATSGAFGVVATASVFPILAILVSGILNRARAKKSIGHEAGA